MCGIIAYIGNREAKSILIEGLKRLEYRGYDSAGVALIEESGELQRARSVGRVLGLEERVAEGFNGSLGIAHTRWATHGGVSEPNAHPHVDDSKLGHGITLVHNGIIENYASIKQWLLNKNHVFESETDTEVLAHLIGELYDGDLEKAVQAALREVTGAYALAVICAKEPDTLVVARKGSPLMVGVGADEYVVASDSSAIVAHTKQAFTLEDYTVAKITRDAIRTSTVDNVEITPEIRELEVDLAEIELGSFEHYMLKEIYEQPRALRDTLQGRLQARTLLADSLGNAASAALPQVEQIHIVACGTSHHAGMVGRYWLEKLAGVPIVLISVGPERDQVIPRPKAALAHQP